MQAQARVGKEKLSLHPPTQHPQSVITRGSVWAGAAIVSTAVLLRSFTQVSSFIFNSDLEQSADAAGALLSSLVLSCRRVLCVLCRCGRLSVTSQCL